MIRRMPLDGRGDYDALVVRTAYDDAQAWALVSHLLLAAASRDPFIGVYFIDDFAWAGASVDEVLRASRSDPHCSVVFIADAVTMGRADHPLLAVTTGTREELGADEYDAEVAFGRTFRVVPGAVPPIEANRFLGRCDFQDYSKTASEQPDGVFRAFAGHD